MTTPTSAPSALSTSSSCDSTCVGLAVGLGLLFFLIGLLLLCYFRDSLAPSDDKAKKDMAAQQQQPGADHPDLEAGATPAETEAAVAKTDVPQGSSSTSMKRRRTSNNEPIVEVRTIDGTAPNATESEPTRKKLTSNNDSAVDAAGVVRSRRGRRSTNEEFVDASEVGFSSNNEAAVDGAAVRSYRGRRTSSNNERPVEMFEIRSGPPPTDAEVEAARKRAASLERKLEEVSKTHSILTETARRLQQEIADLSAKNNEMQLDKA